MACCFMRRGGAGGRSCSPMLVVVHLYRRHGGSQADTCLSQEGQAGMQAWWARPAERWGPGERLLGCGLFRG